MPNISILIINKFSNILILVKLWKKINSKVSTNNNINSVAIHNVKMLNTSILINSKFVKV